MDIDDLMKDIIRAYPIKEYEKYPDLDWNKATYRKNSLLSKIDNHLFTKINDYCKTVYAHKPYLLGVSSIFGIGQVASNTKLPYPIETYYLKTGIIFGEGDEQTGKFLFELYVEYHKNGKFINFGDKKIKLKKFPFQIFQFCEIELKRIYEIV